jgi:signal transduction histidine kinase
VSGEAKGAAYRGRDRRSRWRTATTIPLATAARQSALLLLAAALPPAFALVRGASADAAANLLQVLAALLAAAAGVATLVSWRVRGTAFPAWFGPALITFGLLRMAYDGLTVLGDPISPLTDSLGPLVIALVVGYLVLRSLLVDEVDSTVTPIDVLAAAATAGIVVLGVLTLTATPGVASGAAPWVQHTAGGLTALVWLSLSFAAGLLRRPAVPRWCSGVLAALGVGAAVHAGAPTQGWAAIVAALAIGAAMALVLSATLWDLRSTLVLQDRYALDLRLGLDSLGAQLRAERSELEERLHDVRNAVAALRSADSTLRRYAERLDEETRTRLANALSSELGRLQTLIEPDRRVAVEEFCVADALAAVVDTERSMGSVVELRLGDLRATGDPEGLAQVVQNLLVNARRYAPGSSITIEGIERTGRVEVRVQDHGPGIAHDERLSVFSRGARGSSAKGVDGDGLGLYVAAKLMAAMGGSLRIVTGRGDGACFAAELPRAGGGQRASGQPRAPQGLRSVS